MVRSISPTRATTSGSRSAGRASGALRSSPGSSRTLCIMALAPSTGTWRRGSRERGRVVPEQLGEDVELVEQHPVLDDAPAREVELLQAPQVHAPARRRAVEAEAAVRAARGPADGDREAL